MKGAERRNSLRESAWRKLWQIIGDLRTFRRRPRMTTAALSIVSVGRIFIGLFGGLHPILAVVSDSLLWINPLGASLRLLGVPSLQLFRVNS